VHKWLELNALPWDRGFLVRGNWIAASKRDSSTARRLVREDADAGKKNRPFAQNDGVVMGVDQEWRPIVERFCGGLAGHPGVLQGVESRTLVRRGEEPRVFFGAHGIV
jgi:hypothetical protein